MCAKECRLHFNKKYENRKKRIIFYDDDGDEDNDDDGDEAWYPSSWLQSSHRCQLPPTPPGKRLVLYNK
jgi:hypothetical protein